MGPFKRARVAFFTLIFLASSCSRPAHHNDLHDLPLIPEETVKSTSERSLVHIFYLIQQNQIKEAIDIVLTAGKEDPYLFHSALLDKLGLAIIEQGLRSNDF